MSLGLQGSMISSYDAQGGAAVVAEAAAGGREDHQGGRAGGGQATAGRVGVDGWPGEVEQGHVGAGAPQDVGAGGGVGRRPDLEPLAARSRASEATGGRRCSRPAARGPGQARWWALGRRRSWRSVGVVDSSSTPRSARHGGRLELVGHSVPVADRTRVRYGRRHGMAQPAGAVARARAAAVRRAGPGHAQLERRRRQPGLVPQRQPYEPPADVARPAAGGGRAYAELHCHSNFSFLDGASHPEELVEEAARLGLEALALTDHDGFYGVVRFAEAARAVGLPTVFGAELTLGRRPRRQAGDARPATARTSSCWPATRRATPGWPGPSARPSWRGRRARPGLDLADLAARRAGPGDGRLAGAHRLPQGHGARPPWWPTGPAAAAPRAAPRWSTPSGATTWPSSCGTTATRSTRPATTPWPSWPSGPGVECVATNNVHYATPARRPLATALAAVRARRSLDELDGWLPGRRPAPTCAPGPSRPGASPATPAWSSGRPSSAGPAPSTWPLVAPELPPFPCPDGPRRDGRTCAASPSEGGRAPLRAPRPPTPVPGGPGPRSTTSSTSSRTSASPATSSSCGTSSSSAGRPTSTARAGARRPTRRSATPSASPTPTPCGLGLLFERFLSPERDGPPDIDLDIESDRREEAIQYVYERYGREHAAQVANVITYRAKSAVRDMAKALGYAPGQQDAWSKQVDAWGPGAPGTVGRRRRPRHPRRRCSTWPPRSSTSPATSASTRAAWSSATGRWSRCARWSGPAWRTAASCSGTRTTAPRSGLVKFDLLGLGMLIGAALRRRPHPRAPRRRRRPGRPSPRTTRSTTCSAGPTRWACSRSRAGPRWPPCPGCKPRTFYDLVVEVALIRPGPIQGGSVHPYIRRRNGAGAGHLPAPAARARRWPRRWACRCSRSSSCRWPSTWPASPPPRPTSCARPWAPSAASERMERLRQRLYEGMAERGITGEVADEIFDKLAAFANFGFPESHSVSFAYLVYASSWIKLHEPGGVLRRPAQRPAHGLLLAALAGAGRPPPRRGGAHPRPQRLARPRPPSSPCADEPPGGVAVRLGIGVGARRRRRPGRAHRRRAGPTPTWRTWCAGCRAHPRRSSRRWPPPAPSAASALRPAGGAVGGGGGGPGPARPAGRAWSPAREAPPLPGMSRAGGGGGRPVGHRRVARRPPHPLRPRPPRRARRGHRPTGLLRRASPAAKVLVGGVVTHRQRPATAAGTTFLNLEDETGLINVVVLEGVLGPLPRGGPLGAGPAGAGPAGAGRGGDQRGGRADRGPVRGGGGCARDFR